MIERPCLDHDLHLERAALELEAVLEDLEHVDERLDVGPRLDLR